jgi:hypothetical protein
MPLTVPTTVFPSERRALGIAKETTPGTGVLPAYTIPVKGYVPEDKPIWLPDESMRAAMAMTYGLIQGPYDAEITIDQSFVYGDTIGHALLNIFGDYTATGSGTGSSTFLTSALAVGGTIGTVTSTAGFGSGSNVQIGTAGAGQTPEIVTLTGVSAGFGTFANTPARWAHGSGAAFSNVISPFVHVFSLLNGTGNAQPATHTLTDINFIGTINSGGARWYPFSCFSEITFTGNAEQAFQWAGKAMGYANGTIPSAPTVSVSSIPGQPVWRSTVGLGGTVTGAQVYNVGEWEFTLTRVVEPYFTADASQNPYIIGRGKFSTTGKMNFTPTISELPLYEMLSNTQPQVQIIQNNGLTGASLVQVQFDMQVCAFDASVIEPTKALFGYNNNFQAIANTTNVGGSAGYSPVAVTVTNAIPTY